jgi:hypothetical protein
VIFAVFLLMVPAIASAGTNIVVTPLTQEIPVGKEGIYIITVNTDDVGPHTLSFNTMSGHIGASFTSGGPYYTTGSQSWTATSGTYTYIFYFYVKPGDNAVIGQKYTMEVKDTYSASPTTFHCVATASVIPVYELATISMVGLGIAGLIGYSNRKQKA